METAVDHAVGRTGLSVDRTALKVNQAAIVALLLLAFVLALPWLVALVAVVMALGTISPQLALFQRLYRDVLRPAGLLHPDLRDEAAAPHRFAQGLGATVLGAAWLALVAGLGLLGWALTLVAVALAAINLFFGFCVGCFVYLQLARLRQAR